MAGSENEAAGDQEKKANERLLDVFLPFSYGGKRGDTIMR